jgi:hypothetical protein
MDPAVDGHQQQNLMFSSKIPKGMNKNSLEAISAPSATIANLASETVETK